MRNSLLLTLLLLLSEKLFAQNTNEIYLPLYGSYFFNGSPYKLNRIFLFNGITIKGTIDQRRLHGLYLNLHYLFHDYKSRESKGIFDLYGRSYNGIPIHSIAESHSSGIAAGYFRKVFSNKFINIDAKGMLAFRINSRNVILHSNFKDIGEVKLQDLRYNNQFGLGTGLDINIPLYKRLYAKCELSFIRYQNSDPIVSNYDGITYYSDPQQNTLITGFGLVYGFGKFRYPKNK